MTCKIWTKNEWEKALKNFVISRKKLFSQK